MPGTIESRDDMIFRLATDSGKWKYIEGKRKACDNGEIHECTIGEKFDLFNFFAFMINGGLLTKDDRSEKDGAYKVSEFSEKPHHFENEAKIWLDAGMPNHGAKFEWSMALDQIDNHDGRTMWREDQIGMEMAENEVIAGSEKVVERMKDISKKFNWDDEKIQEIMKSYEKEKDQYIEEEQKKKEREQQWKESKESRRKK